MHRLRHREAILMVCALAGVIALASSAIAASTAIVQIQYPVYLNPVGISQSAGIDLGVNQNTQSFGGLIVSDTGTFGFIPQGGPPEYTNDNGFPDGAYGYQGAIQDAINAGGNNYTATQVNNVSTYIGLSSSYASADQNNLTVLGYLDNAINGPGTKIYNTWRGVAITAAMGDVSLISPTYYGNALMNGNVTSADYGQWSYAYGISQAGYQIDGWGWGDFDSSGAPDASSYGAWSYVYGLLQEGLINPISNFGQCQALGTPVSPPQPQAQVSGVSAVPEPGTCSLLIAAAMAAAAFGFRRRRAAS